LAKKSNKRAGGAVTQPVKPSSRIGAGTLVASLLGTLSFVMLFGWNGLHGTHRDEPG
jgi:hypothetical protein